MESQLLGSGIHLFLLAKVFIRMNYEESCLFTLLTLEITCGDESLLLQNLKRVNDMGTEYNATAIYKCDTGYNPKTLQKFRCGLKGTWEAVKKQEECSRTVIKTD